MGMSEILQARAAAALAEAEKKQQSAAPTSTIENGMQGAITPGTEDTPKPEPVVEDDGFYAALAENYAEAETAYLLLTIRQLVLSGGRIVKPDAAGVIVPEDAKTLEMLQYLDKQNQGFVRKLK